MSAFSHAKHQARLTTHHVFFFESQWGHGYQKRLRDHPANTPLLETATHQGIHNELRRRDMDGATVLPREWINNLMTQCRAEQTLDSITRMQLCLGNLAVVGGQDRQYGDLYVDLANRSIDFLGIQRDMMRGEIYVPKVVFQKE